MKISLKKEGGITTFSRHTKVNHQSTLITRNAMGVLWAEKKMTSDGNTDLQKE